MTKHLILCNNFLVAIMGIEPASLGHLASPLSDVHSVKITRSLGDTNNKQLEHDTSVCLEQFSRCCESFYNSSLMISNSSTSLDKHSGYAMTNDRKVSQGKIVVEALDRISAMRAAAENCCTSKPTDVQKNAQRSLAKLREEYELIADSNRGLFDDCGLLNVHVFIATASKNEVHDSIFEKYTQMRDEIRRQSHKSAMLQRQSSLYQLLSENEHAYSNPSTTATPGDNSKSLTQLKHVKQAISITEQFVRKYKRNIGSHSFLAGMHRLIHQQLHATSKSDVVQWNFRGPVLTEACHSNCVGDNEAYARDATKLLFAFLTWIRRDYVEDGKCPNNAKGDVFLFDEMNQSLHDMDPTLCFQVDQYISNNNLRRILSVLPDPKELDARPTGSINVYSFEIDGTNEKSMNEKVPIRMNIDGRLDEAWPWWQLHLCNLL